MRLTSIIVCCILAACDNNVDLNSRSCEDAKSDINFVSFNCAWAPGMVPRTLDRVGPGIEAIKNLDFDVLCLQETWLPEHRDALTVALNLPETQVFTIDTRNDDLGTRLGETSEDVCTDEELSGTNKSSMY